MCDPEYEYVSAIAKMGTLSKMRVAIHDIAQMDRGRLRIGILSIRRPFTIFSRHPGL